MYTLRLCTAAWNVGRSGPHWSPLYIEVWATECDDVAFFFWGDDVARHTWRSAYIAYVPFFFPQRLDVFVTQKWFGYVSMELITCRLCTHQTWFESSKLNHRMLSERKTNVITNSTSSLKRASPTAVGSPDTSDLHLRWQREKGGLGKLVPSTSWKLTPWDQRPSSHIPMCCGCWVNRDKYLQCMTGRPNTIHVLD